MVWGAPGSVPGHRGGKWDRSQIWALCAYMVPSSSVYGVLQTPTPAPENAGPQRAGIRWLDSVLPAASELKGKAALCSQACTSHLKR